MISAALTSFLTGITEPIEFSFMFVAPILYVIHAILAGLAFPICILLGMRDGTSFSHGLIRLHRTERQQQQNLAVPNRWCYLRSGVLHHLPRADCQTGFENPWP